MRPGLFLGFQAESWQQPARMWHKQLKLLICKIWFLGICYFTSQHDSLSNSPYVSVTSEPVRLPRGHGPTTMGQTHRWQQVQASGTRWHRFDVFYSGFGWGCVVSTWIEGLTGQSNPKWSWQQPSGNQQQTTQPRTGRHVATAPRINPTNHARQHVLQWCVQQLWCRLPN